MPKKINFKVIVADDDPEPFRIMNEIREEWFPHIHEAKIALAWSLNVKPNADGHVTLGKCIRASDLQRELVDYDFVILLNKEVWESEEFTREKKTALMDHELMHAERAQTADGEPSYDERGRPVWRIRGHDIEEFTAIVRRHGTYKKDLEAFAQELLRRKGQPLFATQGLPASGLQRLADEDNANITVSDEHGEVVAEFTPRRGKQA